MSSPACLKLIDRCVDEGGTLTIDDRIALSDGERQELVEFIAGVSASMADDRPDRLAPVAEILATYPAQTGADGAGKVKGGVYAKALGDVPGWAIEQACTDFVAGRIPEASRTYAPTPTVLRVQAEKYVTRARADAYRARQLLKAKPVRVVTEAEREAVKARMAKLVAGLRADDDKGAGE